MKSTTTERLHLSFGWVVAFIALASVFLLNFTLQPYTFESIDSDSWTVNGGSKVPVISNNSAEPQEVVLVAETSWAMNGGSKVPQIERGSSLDYELIEGVPWAANGGAKVPAFDFIR